MAFPEPFGGILILAVALVCFVIGLAILITGRGTMKSLVRGMVVIAAPWIILALLAILSPGIDDWNPSFDSDSVAWGSWEGDGYLVELRADSTFEVTFRGDSMNGTWKRMDWNLYLTNVDGEERYMRFVAESGELILLPDPPRDDSFEPGPITRRK